MSISSQASRADYTGNGTQSIFSYAFKIFSEDDLLVTVLNTTTKVETTLTKTTDYTVSGVGETAGGNVTLVSAGQAWLDGDGDLDTGYRMSIRRVPDIVQETDIRNQGQYFPEGIENQFDKQVMIDQRQEDEIQRAIRLPETQTDGVDFNTHLPADFAGQANKSLVTNATGDGFSTGPSTDEIANAQAYAIDANEHKQTAERWANFTTGSVVDVDTGVDSLEYSSKAYAIGGTGVTETAARGAAKEWATKTDNPVDTAEYSAKEYAQGTQAGKGGSSKQWAQETASDVDSTGEYSAKEYAQGIQAGTGGSAKDWASETATDVDSTGEYSAKEHAQGIQTRGLAGGGSAKDWAQHIGSTVDNVEFSSKKYAQDAAASAAAAATNASASLWQDVVFKTFADTPIAIVDGDAGKMFAIDCSGGSVVVNLPSIALLTLTGPWSVGIQKSDSSANTITINANGTDTIAGNASLTLTKASATATLLPDTDPTPDEWTPIVVGEYPVSGNLVGDTDTQTLTNKTIAAGSNTITGLTHGTEVDNPSSGVHGVTGSIVGTSDTQVLSNKEFSDAITLNEIATPSTPATNKHKIYMKSDGKFYRLNDAGDEVEVGAGGGSGQGGINYVINNDAELNLDNTSTDGSGNVTIALETTDPVRGLQSFKIEANTSATSTQYAQLDLNAIDRRDYESSGIMTLQFDYYTTAGYAVGDDLKVELRRNTATAADLVPLDGGVIPPAPNKTTYTTRIQLNNDASDYSLRFKSNGVTATRGIVIDNIRFGPDNVVPGANITDWQTYTPATTNGLGVVTNGELEYRRDGSDLLIRGVFTKSAGSAAEARMDLPPNLTSSSGIETLEVCGDAGLSSNSAAAYYVGIEPSSTYFVFLAQSGTQNTSAKLNGNALGGAENIRIEARIPIEGWNSGASLSTTETLFSTTKARMFLASNQTVASAGETVVTLNTTTYDQSNMVDTANNRISIPTDGFYHITGSINLENILAGDLILLRIRRNASTIILKEIGLPNIVNQPTTCTWSDIVKCSSGDLIDISVDSFTDTSYTVAGGSNETYLTVERRPDFSVFSVYNETSLIEASSNLIAYPITVNQWGDLTSISLPPGEWDVSCQATYFSNGATTTADIFLGLSSTTGNVSPGNTGEDRMAGTKNTASGSYDPLSHYKFGVVTTSQTTYYLKAFAGTSITNLQVGYKISARKIK